MFQRRRRGFSFVAASLPRFNFFTLPSQHLRAGLMNGVASRLYELLRGFLAGADAIGDADAAVAVAGERETWAIAGAGARCGRGDRGVRRRTGPWRTSIYRRGRREDSARRPRICCNSLRTTAMMASSESCQIFSAFDAGEEAAEQGAIVGGAVGKFVVNESRGQQTVAFAARDEKSEAGWERSGGLRDRSRGLR